MGRLERNFVEILKGNWRGRVLVSRIPEFNRTFDHKYNFLYIPIQYFTACIKALGKTLDKIQPRKEGTDGEVEKYWG